ncbi:PAS domain S-box protein [Halobaculum limi]|uniref:PAS domain S-box protein n=1 Tax=Halobaculum limi TaxID=3031916 RepID=UPI002406C7B9|nr:PAS domain S-box protein [Halobaculum sp. YSMS11]
MRGYDAASIRSLFPDRTRDLLSVQTTGSESDAVARLAGGDVDCLVCVHDPPMTDATAVIRRLRAAVPDGAVFAACRSADADAPLDAGATEILPIVDGAVRHRLAVSRLDAHVDYTEENAAALSQRAPSVADNTKVGPTAPDSDTDDPSERELVAARDDLRRTLDRVSDGFFAITTNWEVTYTNQFGEQTLRDLMHIDDEASSLIGETLIDHAPEALESAFYEEFTEAMETQETVSLEEHYEPIGRDFSVAAYPSESGLSVYFRDITERKERERELVLKTRAIDTAPIGITITDPNKDGNPIVYANNKFEEITGYHSQRVIGRNCRFLQGEDTDEAAIDRLRTAVEHEGSTEVELRNYRADGRVFWNEVVLAPIFDADGDVVNFTGFQRDVTKRKRREQTLNTLVETTRDFQQARDLNELLESLVRSVQRVFGHDLSIIRLHDPETGRLVPAYESGLLELTADPYPPVDDAVGPSGRAFQTGEPVIVDNLGSINDRDYGPANSGMILPLGDHGTLGVGSSEVDAFDSEDAALVKLLARAATSAFDRIDQQSEMRRLKRIVDHVDEKAFLLDEAGRFTFVTGEMEASVQSGSTLTDGVALSSVVANVDDDRVEAVLADLRTAPPGTSHTVETWIQDAESDLTPVEVEVSSVDESRQTGVVAGRLTDITKLAETRTDLRHERDRFRELFENLPDPIADIRFVDGDPIVEYANPAFESVFGLSTDEVHGASINDLIVPRELLEAAHEFDEAVRVGAQFGAEVQRSTEQGRLDFLLRGIPYTHDETECAFAVYTDITEQRERERYLQILNRVLRHNLRNDLNVVMGIGEHIAESIDDADLGSSARVLTEKARKATTLSEKAKRIEQVLGTRGRKMEQVNLSRSLARVIEAQRSRFPDAEITADVPHEVYVQRNQDVDVRRAFVELVENAIEHNARSDARLHVDVIGHDDGGDTTCVRFTDNGPGIPASEWSVITGGQEISQLTHASGLGLWLTRWLAEAHDGRLLREQTDGPGSMVVLELQTATR